MLDGKVLTAVFASLAAIAAAMNGGGLDPGQVKSSTISAPGDNTFNQLMPDSLRSLGDFFNNPEPENEVFASLEVADIDDAKLQVKADWLEPRNMTSYRLGVKNVKSDEDIRFYGFKGTVEPGDVTGIKGRSNGIVSSGINISGSMNIEEDVDTSLVALQGVERSSIKLDDISGSIKSNSTTTRIKDASTKLDINSFSGRMIIYPDNETIILDGKVDRLEAGPVSFGGR